jgi:hypothetical protein
VRVNYRRYFYFSALARRYRFAFGVLFLSNKARKSDFVNSAAGEMSKLIATLTLDKRFFQYSSERVR